MYNDKLTLGSIISAGVLVSSLVIGRYCKRKNRFYYCLPNLVFEKIY
jgi:hypothetical protein